MTVITMATKHGARPSPPDRLPAISIGVSACLLGERVRYDGDHKLDVYIRDTLGRHFELVAICPETAIGMGVPRPPIQLVGGSRAPRAVGVVDPTLDVTDKLAGFAKAIARAHTGISGYIFKSRSPSCGVQGVRVHGANAVSHKSGRGIFAAGLMKELRLMPVIEEQQLGDPACRDNFLERVCAYHRWQMLNAAGLTVTRLREFHEAHALVFIAHGVPQRAELHRLVAHGRGSVRVQVAKYGRCFMNALAQRATRARHASALRYACRYLTDRLDVSERKELRASIESYRAGDSPWLVPAMLLRNHFRRYPDPWIARQVYLYPHPCEWAVAPPPPRGGSRRRSGNDIRM